MKTKIIPIIPIFTFLLTILCSCDDTTYKEYQGNAPVYLSYEDLRSAVIPEQDVELKNPGKIYFKDDYIFIIEELKGIHVFDNSEPSLPVRKTFVKIPGVVDMAVSGQILFADSFVDLVALDLKDIENIHEAGRVKDIFPYIVPPVDNEYPMGYVDRRKGVVIDWELKKIREKVNNNPYPYPIFWLKEDAMFSTRLTGNQSGVSGTGIGVGGSMARFGLKDKVLYVLDNNTLKILDITDKADPSLVNEFYPGWGIETMFITGSNMFLGTTTGMLIYDISIPLSPLKMGTFNHARACDPVIVDDTLAYVTLRSGTTCGGIRNVLDVVNIKNLFSPVLVSSYALTSPHGLGKDGNLLFICDGNEGLKIFDAGNPRQITNHLIYAYPDINAYDVIPLGEVLVLIGDDGLFQYNYSDVTKISLLSMIKVANK